MNPVIRLEDMNIWFDGMFGEPRLAHPEGICVDSNGDIWCSGEEGQIYRIYRDGSNLRLVAKTDGFGLGITLDDKGRVYLCDAKHACVFRYEPDTGKLYRFAVGNDREQMKCPNYAIVDTLRNCVYVSDTQKNGPGVWRFDLESGCGDLWYAGNCFFANGLALSQDNNELYLVETDIGLISKIKILSDGSAGEKTRVLELPGTVPDGLAFDYKGRLYISCYAPSMIYRLNLDDQLEVIIQDEHSRKICFPTNMVFRGKNELFFTNHGAWHIGLVKIHD
jgi:sugar lactone lactonase YvrE